MNELVYVVALGSILLGAIGQFLLKLGANRLPTGLSVVQSLVRMLLTPQILIGLACFGSSFLAWVFVLTKLPLSVAYPMVSLSYIIVALLAAAFLREPLSGTRVLGLGLIIAGVILIQMKAA